MPTLKDAIILAATHHEGQVDKVGQPYILHVLRVMLQLKTEKERIAGVLHDIVEDCSVTFDDLAALGYDDEIIDTIRCVSKLPEEEDNYAAFIQRVSRGSLLTRRVKIADLEDNADLSRIPNPTEKDFRRTEKYLRAIKLLRAV